MSDRQLHADRQPAASGGLTSDGGGIENYSATLTVSNSRLISNVVIGGAGGLRNVRGGGSWRRHR